MRTSTATRQHDDLPSCWPPLSLTPDLAAYIISSKRDTKHTMDPPCDPVAPNTVTNLSSAPMAEAFVHGHCVSRIALLQFRSFASNNVTAASMYTREVMQTVPRWRDLVTCYSHQESTMSWAYRVLLSSVRLSNIRLGHQAADIEDSWTAVHAKLCTSTAVL